MATTVHIPKALLDKLDERAKQTGTSRNRLIVNAVEASLRDAKGWPVGFFERLRNVEPEYKDAVDEMMEHIIKNRRSRKGPPKL